MSLYNPCSRNHVGKVFYYLFGTIRGVCCQKWSVNRGGGAKEFCDLKITCQFFSVNNTGEITAQYEAIFARYIITDVFVFVCNENPYLMWNLAKSPWLEALISGIIKIFLSIMRYKMMPRFCWFNQWENWSFAVTQNPKLNCKLEVKKMLLGFDAYARWLPVVIITRKRKFVGGKYKTGSASFYGV